MNPYTHILVPTDFSKTSGLAVSRAKSLVQKFGAKITVLHVVNYVPPGYIAPELPGSLATESALIERARSYLAGWLEQYDLSDCAQLIVSGSAKTEIVNAAREQSADLIVMGTHGETGLARFMGSTANAVIHHAHCDVLTTRLSQ